MPSVSSAYFFKFTFSYNIMWYVQKGFRHISEGNPSPILTTEEIFNPCPVIRSHAATDR